MGGGRIEPGVVGRGAIVGGVPVQLRQRAGIGGVVEHHVEDDGDAAFVAFVDQQFQRLRCSVIFVQRFVKIRIVAPAVIAFEFVHGHQFDGRDAEAFDVIERIEQVGVVVRVEKVAEQQFVDDEIGFFRTLVARCLPVEGLLRGFQHRHDACGLARRVGGKVGVRRGRDEWVVAGVEHQRAQGVGDAHGAVDKVLKAVGLPRRQARHVEPPRGVVRTSFHLVTAVREPVVEIAHDVHHLLVRSVQREANRLIVNIIDTQFGSVGERLRRYVARNDVKKGGGILFGGGGGHKIDAVHAGGPGRQCVTERFARRGGDAHAVVIQRQGSGEGRRGVHVDLRARARQERRTRRGNEGRQQGAVCGVNVVKNIRVVGGPAHDAAALVSEYESEFQHRFAGLNIEKGIDGEGFLPQIRPCAGHLPHGISGAPGRYHVLPVARRRALVGNNAHVRVHRAGKTRQGAVPLGCVEIDRYVVSHRREYGVAGNLCRGSFQKGEEE